MNKKIVRKIIYATAVITWVIAVVVLLSGLVVILPISLINPAILSWFSSTALGNVALNVLVYGVALVFVLAPFIIKKLSWHQITRKLALKKPSWRIMLLAVALWLLYMIISSLVQSGIAALNLPWFNVNQIQEVGFKGLTQPYEYGLAFVGLVLLPPLFEEIIFRGYLFGRLRAVSGFLASTLLTSLAFAVVHMQLNVAVDVFILSLFLCFMRERSGSIWPGVFVHGLKNAMAFFALFIAPIMGINLL